MTANANGQSQSPLIRQNYFVALRFVLLPLAIFLLANVIFSLVASDIDQLVSGLKKLIGLKQISIDPFVEARLRLNWGTTVLLFYSTLIAVSIFCIAIIRQSFLGKRKAVFIAVGAFIALAVLGHVAYSGYFRTEFSYIFFFTFDALTASEYYSDSQLAAIKWLVSGINVMSAIVSTLALVTGCCIFADKNKIKKFDVNILVTQMRQLKKFISIVSVMLVAGVLHMIAWLHLPTALIADKSLAKHVIEFSEAMGLYWGATFSLLIATFYIPAAWSISNRAEAIITEFPEQTQGMEMQEWLQKHSISLSPLQQVPQLLAVLAPLLVGPIGSALTNLSGPLAGG
jgi:hypothetical protein